MRFPAQGTLLKPYRESCDWLLIQWYDVGGEVARSLLASVFSGARKSDHRSVGLALESLSCSTVSREDHPLQGGTGNRNRDQSGYHLDNPVSDQSMTWSRPRAYPNRINSRMDYFPARLVNPAPPHAPAPSQRFGTKCVDV